MSGEREILRGLGACGEISPDGAHACIIDAGHHGPHGWDAPDYDQAYANTDRELWREVPDGDPMSYYSPSIHVTGQGGIGINVGGYVFVKTLREWHALAVADYRQRETRPGLWHRIRERLAA